jgi:NAD(P)-dependent dehydrogenase (short-subunit alcohol dehydrogenase family)
MNKLKLEGSEMDKNLDVGPLVMDKTGLKKEAMAGEVAVVTGAAGNVGMGTARSLAWLGAKIVIADVNARDGKTVEDVINRENKPGTALFVETDVSNEASMKAMAKKAFDTFGKVDILVNNAMNMSLGARILDSTIQQLDRQYEISTRGTFIGIQQFLPGMRERRHGIITYMSTGMCYPIGPANYCAIKAATASIIMSLAGELGPYEETGIAVFMFLPAGIGMPRSAAPRTGAPPPPPPPSPAGQPERPMMRGMPGYDGMIPPEHGGAAMAYCITRAKELHRSGVTVTQAFRQMNWVYPKPETVMNREMQRIDDMAAAMVFSLMGQGFPDPKMPLNPIARQ